MQPGSKAAEDPGPIPQEPPQARQPNRDQFRLAKGLAARSNLIRPFSKGLPTRHHTRSHRHLLAMSRDTNANNVSIVKNISCF
jgi:hypothetical protein